MTLSKLLSASRSQFPFQRQGGWSECPPHQVVVGLKLDAVYKEPGTVSDTQVFNTVTFSPVESLKIRCPELAIIIYIFPGLLK